MLNYTQRYASFGSRSKECALVDTTNVYYVIPVRITYRLTNRIENTWVTTAKQAAGTWSPYGSIEQIQIQIEMLVLITVDG